MRPISPNRSDVLLTEDEETQGLKGKQEFQEHLQLRREVYSVVEGFTGVPEPDGDI